MSSVRAPRAISNERVTTNCRIEGYVLMEASSILSHPLWCKAWGLEKS